MFIVVNTNLFQVNFDNDLKIVVMKIVKGLKKKTLIRDLVLAFKSITIMSLTKFYTLCF